MDAALSLPPASVPVATEPTRADPRVLGLAIGAAVPALIASAAWWMGVPWIAAIAAAGILLGGAIGGLTGRRIVEPGWVGTSLIAALVAPIVAAGVIAIVFLETGSGSTVEGSPQSLASWIFVSALVTLYAVFFGVPMTLPTAIVVSVLVRRAYRMSARRARLHVGLLVVTAAAVGATTLLGAFGLLAPFGIHGFVDSGY